MSRKRPDFVRSRHELEAPAAPPDSPEDFGFASEFAPAAGIAHLRIAHFRIPPGKRAYPPLAARDLEIFMFVLEGQPDLWIDGNLHRLAEGEGVCLPARTGMAHSLINNTNRDTRVFVMSQAFPRAMKVANPLDPSDAILKKMDMHWADAPKRKLGPNKGNPGDESGRKRGKPAFVTHWRDILDAKPGRYPGSDEDQGIDARFGLKARFSRIGIHVEVLKPGRRTSWPHAERDEDEFVYVVSGAVDAWNDGYITPISEGDFVGWAGGTGITHAILNNSDQDAILLIGGEASRTRNQFWYPFHPKRNKEVGALYWADHPVPKLGPHHGMPDALRARVPKKTGRSAIAANEGARFLGKSKKRK